MFAIKTCHIGDRTTVRHLPREISWPTKYRIDRGAKVTAKLSSTDYTKSPLFQGSLEIQCVATITLPTSIKGQMLIQRYKEMVESSVKWSALAHLKSQPFGQNFQAQKPVERSSPQYSRTKKNIKNTFKIN